MILSISLHTNVAVVSTDRRIAKIFATLAGARGGRDGGRDDGGDGGRGGRSSGFRRRGGDEDDMSWLP